MEIDMDKYEVMVKAHCGDAICLGPECGKGWVLVQVSHGRGSSLCIAVYVRPQKAT